MRFPFLLTVAMTTYMAKMRVLRKKYFPLVLMLEPLHACNLHCIGCGRIREYSDTLHQRMPPDECVASTVECGAPVVSICGGEPLIYPEIHEIVARILAMGKHIYLCTNGQLLAEKAESFWSIPGARRRLYWNVHLDSSETAHDTIVAKSGAFQKAVAGITAAKQAGFFVYTNSTLYRQTTLDELEKLAAQLLQLDIDGMMVAPGFHYESVATATENTKNQEGEDTFFLSRNQTHTLFQDIRKRFQKYRLTATPLYMDFLCGQRSLACAAWANPTRNIKGWKGPCYLITDQHYPTYQELIDQTDWSHFASGTDPRCRHCLMHCGFEPAAVFQMRSTQDLLRTALWQLGW